jgi:hypothetical protein
VLFRSPRRKKRPRGKERSREVSIRNGSCLLPPVRESCFPGEKISMNERIRSLEAHFSIRSRREMAETDGEASVCLFSRAIQQDGTAAYTAVPKTSLGARPPTQTSPPHPFPAGLLTRGLSSPPLPETWGFSGSMRRRRAYSGGAVPALHRLPVRKTSVTPPKGTAAVFRKPETFPFELWGVAQRAGATPERPDAEVPFRGSHQGKVYAKTGRGEPPPVLNVRRFPPERCSG